MATELGQVGAVTASAQGLYWADRRDGGTFVGRWAGGDLCQGTRCGVPVPAEEVNPGVGRQGVYVGTPEGVHALAHDLTGQRFFAGGGPVMKLAVGEQVMAWSHRATLKGAPSERVVFAYEGPGSPGVIFESDLPVSIQALTWQGTDLLVAATYTTAARQVVQRATPSRVCSGSCPLAVNLRELTVLHMVADAEALYLVARRPPAGVTVARLPTDGSCKEEACLEVLATVRDSSPLGITLDGDYVYWADETALRRVLRTGSTCADETCEEIGPSQPGRITAFGQGQGLAFLARRAEDGGTGSDTTLWRLVP